MKYYGIAALSAVGFFATAAIAAPDAAPVKLSASECTSLWAKANPSGAPGVTASQSAGYVSDFKAANPDGDTTIDQAEWMSACNKGLVKSSSSTGSSSGASGSSDPASSSAPAKTPSKN